MDDVAKAFLRRSGRVRIESRKVEDVPRQPLEVVEDGRPDVGGHGLAGAAANENARPEAEVPLVLLVDLRKEGQL